MRNAWKGELLKVATVRGQWISILLAAVAIPLTSLLVAASGGLSDGDTVTSGAATGTVAGLLAIGSWAAVITAGEYSRQTLVVSLANVPSRIRLYGAKLAAVTAIAAAAALASAFVSWLVVLGVTPHATSRMGDPAALLGIVLAVVAVAAVGVSAGFLTRSPAASIAAVFALVLLPQAAGGLLGGLQEWIVGASPGQVVTQIVDSAQLATDQTYPGGSAAAALTLVAFAAVIAAVGGCVLCRRDG